MGFSFYSQGSGCEDLLECKMAFVLRIKFPPTYPLIYKTLRVDSELSVEEAITFIGETLHVPAGENIGLYIPQTKQWLDSETPLKEYPILEDAVCVFSFLSQCFLKLLMVGLFRKKYNLKIKMLLIQNQNHKTEIPLDLLVLCVIVVHYCKKVSKSDQYNNIVNCVYAPIIYIYLSVETVIFIIN